MCDHSFISYDPKNDPDNPFLCKECDGTWAYHPHDKVAIDALVDQVMCSHVNLGSQVKCDNIAEIDGDYCKQHNKRVRLWDSVVAKPRPPKLPPNEKPVPPGNPGSPPA